MPGAATMREAIAAIEDVTTQPNLRAFWWTVGALLEALQTGALERSFGAKQLVARIDMQIRRVDRGQREGRRPAAPRSALLRRDGAAGRRRRSRRCSAPINLAALIPTAEALDADVVRLQPLLREARDQLAQREGRVAQGRVGTRRQRCRSLQQLARLGATRRRPRSGIRRCRS